MEALDLHRLQFAFTVTYHYLFPQLTMGLAFVILALKTLGLRRRDEAALAAARFWTRIFGIAFIFGVVTGIPMEFQFGTNWARFSAQAGESFAQLLAMEGVFAFFLESSFLYALLYRERDLGPRVHWIAALLLWLGTWASGFFIVAVNAWMQHPVGTRVGPDGGFELVSLSALFTNPWLWPQYAHTMLGSLVTASFVVAGTGAFYLLRGEHVAAARRCVQVALPTGLAAAVLAAFPTGDLQAKAVLEHQPVTFAAMEGLFHSEEGAALTLIGQPDMEALDLDNPLEIPKLLSFITYRRWDAEVHGLTEFPREDWPDHVPLLYYAYHIMVGLGTMFIAVLGLATLALVRGTLERRPALLWSLVLFLPLPFVANTAGWMTAELGRQPWVVHGLLRTADASSANVSGGNVLMTLLGYAGLYTLLSVLVVLLVARVVARGPAAVGASDGHAAGGAA
ncbi:MAG: cytochrome ubiquinol oxidase subunit I [Planctomycetes bacterium]|nr:cytochrome ubiquinol oxidase subunit I [Planctomycetota bacterium]